MNVRFYILEMILNIDVPPHTVESSSSSSSSHIGRSTRDNVVNLPGPFPLSVDPTRYILYDKEEEEDRREGKGRR